MSKAKQGMHSLVAISRQMFSYFWKSRAHNAFRGDKCHHSECLPLPPSFPQLLLLSMTPYDTEHRFGQSGLAVLAVSLLSSWCTPSLLTGRVAWEAEKTLALCEHCTATTKNIHVLSLLFSSEVQNTKWYEPLQRKLTLS